jgi:acyl carrier protein
MNNKIREIMAKSFDVPVGEISESTSKDNLDNWDSLHHIMMIVALEKEFNILIPDETVSNMISFKLIESVIQECHEI